VIPSACSQVAASAEVVVQTPLKMPLSMQRDAGCLSVGTGFPIELNDIDGVTRASHVDAHAAGESPLMTAWMVLPTALPEPAQLCQSDSEACEVP